MFYNNNRCGARLSIIKCGENGAIVSFPIPHLFLFSETKIGTLTSLARDMVIDLNASESKDFSPRETGHFTDDSLAGKATGKDVTLIRRTVGASMGLKASVGIRTLKKASALIETGGDRIGTCAGVQIKEEIPE